MPQTRSAFLAMIGQPAGKPSRNRKYTPDVCLRIRELASQGIFPEGWALEVGVTLETFRIWGHQNPEFSEALSMSRLALIDFWTRELIRNLNNPQARTGIYNMLVRRFPALYGANPVDLAEWLTTPPDAPQSAPQDTFAERVKAMSDEELQARLAALRARRMGAE